MIRTILAAIAVLSLACASADIAVPPAEEVARPQTVAGETAATSGQQGGAVTPEPQSGQPAAMVSAIEGETRAQMLRRLQLEEDPGLEPDSEKVWNRGGNLFQIHRYDRQHAVFSGQPEGWVRPYGPMNTSREVFQMDEQYVWTFEPVEIVDGEVLPAAEAQRRRVVAERSDPAKAREDAQASGWTDEVIGFVQQIRPDFEPLAVPAAGRTVRFRESSEGLPADGSWRNSGAFADMNRDGRVDVVLPPPRGAGINSTPLIYLGDGQGRWSLWEEPSFPQSIDYGSVAVGDLNKDGYPDIVAGIHLRGVGIYLGGKDGYFTDATPKTSKRFNTRRAIITDLDADGHLDVVALSEGPAMMQQASEMFHPSNVIAFLNDGTGENWTEVDIAEPRRQVGGDWMVAANLNGDRYPDIAASSNYFNGPDVMYLSQGRRSWTAFGRGSMPFYSYYGALTAGQFVRRSKTDQVIYSYARTWPQRAPIEAPSLSRVSGLEMITLDRRGNLTRTPISRTEGGSLTRAMASADFDRDGNLDVLYVQEEPREFVLLLGDGKGGFRRGELEGLELAGNLLYDIGVGDVNGDGRADLLLLYERMPEAPGSVRVYLGEK